MAANNIKPWGIGAGANVITQAQYEALTALATGFVAGKASSAQINKVLRQASFIAAALAQVVSDKTASDVLDNGDLPALVTLMKSALTPAASTIPISGGGTGATTAAAARTNLGLGSVATKDIVPVSGGGTGAANVADALTNLNAYSKTECESRFSPLAPAYTAVGSHVLARNSGGAISPGSSVPGSQLTASTADGNTSGGTLPGTWRIMGYSDTTNDAHRTSLFLRIS